MWEASRIGDFYIDKINLFDRVIVPNKWIIQRVSAVLLMPLLLFFLYSLVDLVNKDYTGALDFFDNYFSIIIFMSATTFITQRQLMVKGMPKMDSSNNMMLQQQTGEFCAAHFFDTGSAAAVGRQGRWTQRSFVWLATGSGRWKVENFDSNGCVHRARAAGRRRRCIAGCAELRAGEATYARGRKCENALELRGRASAEFPGQAMHGAL